MLRTIAITTVAAGLSGCGAVTRIGDKIVGLTNPVLVGGLIVGTRLPDDPDLAEALEANGVTERTDIRLAVADALELQDVEEALITDAILTLDAPDAVPLVPGDDDWYGLAAPPGPAYVAGETWTLSAELSDRVLPGTVSIPLPEGTAAVLPDVQPPRDALTIDLSGQGYDFAFAAVYDVAGEPLWTNEPAGNDAIVDFVLPGGDPVDEVVLPGEAFPEDGVVIVGIAGMQRAPVEGIEGLNEALTAVLAGELQLEPVVVGSPVGLTAAVLATAPPAPELEPLLLAAGVEATALAEIFVVDLRERAGVTELVPTADGVPMAPAEPPGRYVVDGLDAAPGDVVMVRADTEMSPFASVFAPGVPDPVAVALPAIHPVDTGLNVPLPTETDWAAGVAIVVGPDGLTYTSVPDPADEDGGWQALLEDPTPITALDLPPSAFPAPGPYAVGIAALEDQPDALQDVNGAFSRGVVGTMGFVALTVE
jgi:hypothetical protein